MDVTDHIARLAVQYVPIGDLIPHPTNARTHSAKQVGQIVDSIKTFGWTNPVLVDADRNVLAGHGRLQAARKLGLAEVPTICLTHMSAAEKRAYVIADNQLALTAGWDRKLLASEFAAIQLLDPEFSLVLTGFEIDEIEILLDSEFSGDDDVPAVNTSQPAITQPGDVWLLGTHRLICGDALDPQVYGQLMEGMSAQMVFTDPPYNVPIAGHVSGLSKAQHREFAIAAGEMTPDQFTAFLTAVTAQFIAHSSDGSIHFVCMDWRHIGELMAATRAYGALKNLCVWNKANAGMGSFYRSRHELVFVFKNGTRPHINTFGLGDKGRYRTNVWDYAGMNSWGAERDTELAMHPTVKPLAMVEDAIKDCSRRGGIILDPFGGAGTTLIAAEGTGRCARLIELDPLYVDVTIRRWQQRTGGSAQLAATSQTFAQLSDGGR